MRGVGIKDGRGYGPYGAGYYAAGGGRFWPLGPRGERLGPDYDFRPGPNGTFLPRRLPPARSLVAAPAALSGYIMMGADEPELTDAEWRRAMLATQRETRDWQKKWVIEDKKVRHLQIAATLAIPLVAAIWKLLLKKTGNEKWL
jgi:hypothetical protein